MQLSIPNSASKRCVQCHVYVGGGGGEAVTFLYLIALNMYESTIHYSSPGGLWNHRILSSLLHWSWQHSLWLPLNLAAVRKGEWYLQGFLTKLARWLKLCIRL